MRPGRRTLRRQLPRPQQGLTLVEMLVSLVILGLVMLLVSETVKQVAQVARAADDTTRGFAERWAAGWSAGGLFANLVLPPETGEQAPFKGSAMHVEGYTARPLDAGESGMEAFALDLRFSESNARTSLMTQADAGSSTDATGAAAVAQFPGRAEFAFIDHQGQTLTTWPSMTRTGEAAEDLPRAVLIRDADTSALLMWFDFPGDYIRQRASPGLFSGTSTP
jgi:general secretion pathway protein J